MDLIGSIHHIENRPGGRKPNQGRGKPVRKPPSDSAEDGKEAREDSERQTSGQDSRVGRKIDITV